MPPLRWLVSFALITIVVGVGAAFAPPASVSISMTPTVGTTGQEVLIRLDVVAEDELDLYLFVVLGGRSCPVTILGALNARSEEIREATVTRGSSTHTARFRPLQPGAHWICAYFESGTDQHLFGESFSVAAAARVVRSGRGIGRWKIGQRFAAGEGLRRGASEHYPDNRSAGCVRGPGDATRIDYYADTVRLSWSNGRLFDVATSLGGDRSEDGFVIGRTRIAAVRKRYPSLPVRQTRARWNLGPRVLTVRRERTEGQWIALRHWFDTRGLLVAIETLEARC